MIISSIQVSNFASYKNLEFKTSDKGLMLIQGDNGSGKSTLCDLVPWAFFGQTAKGGAADEVLSWHGGQTEVNIEFYTQADGDHMRIIRTRGPNDLVFYIDDVETRGKDLKDTQKLLNEVLGMDFDSFVTSHYFHEFSKTASFFTATAKQRREITEQLVDMSLANKIQETQSGYKKEVQAELKTTTEHLVKLQSESKWNQEQLSHLRTDKLVHDDTNLHRIQLLRDRASTFSADLKSEAAEVESDHLAKTAMLEKNVVDLKNSLPIFNHTRLREIKQALAELSDTRCKGCGAKKGSDERLVLTRDLHKEETKLKEVERQQLSLLAAERVLSNHKQVSVQSRLDAILLRPNTYKDQIEQLQTEVNPFSEQIKKTADKIKTLVTEIKTHQDKVNELKLDLSDVDKIEEAVKTFRSMLVDSTLGNLENRTNELLTNFFDAEIRIGFSASDTDKIDVSIKKDGNDCNYTQLSKGQRQMLKLCFGVAVMRQCANANGINATALWFDEALDGMSDETKLKAVRLFESLQAEYTSVFVVEHSEAVKAQINNKITVKLTEEGSIIDEI